MFNSGGNFYGSAIPPGAGVNTTVNQNGDPCDQYYNLTMTPAFVSTIYGDFQLTAGSHAIDAGNPALPMDPDLTINDQGALYFYQTPIIVTISSPQPVVIVPGGGGSFPYRLLAENQRNTPQTFDVWTVMRYPDSTISAPLLRRYNLVLPASGSMQRNLTQYVPGSAPGGFYDLIVMVGDYPDSVMHSDALPFMKLLDDGGGGSYVGDWRTEGWDDPVMDAGLQPETIHCRVHPNPFNPSTAISYELRAASHVSLRVYDTAGREARTLMNGWSEAGSHEATFDGSGLPSGVYLLRLEAGNYTAVQKLVLMK
jgi:hypothetical protein